MQARQLSFGAGRVWLNAAFALYRKNPFMITSFGMSYLMLMLTANFLPRALGFLAALGLSLVVVVVANACRVVDLGEPPTRANFLRGIKGHVGALFGLGLVNALASLLLTTVVFGMLGPIPEADESNLGDMLLLVLCLGGVALPLTIAFWFSPLLVAWHDVPAPKAIFFSLVAIWRNWKAFLAYGFLAMGTLFLVQIPIIFIGMILQPLAGIVAVGALMIMWPLLVSGWIYIAFREIFVFPAAEALPNETQDLGPGPQQDHPQDPPHA